MPCSHQPLFYMTRHMGKINDDRKPEFSTLQVATIKLQTECLGSTLQDLQTDTETRN